MHTHKYRKGLESDSPSFRLFLRTYVLQGTNLLKIWEMEIKSFFRTWTESNRPSSDCYTNGLRTLTPWEPAVWGRIKIPGCFLFLLKLDCHF